MREVQRIYQATAKRNIEKRKLLQKAISIMDPDEYYITKEYKHGEKVDWKLYKIYNGWDEDNSKPIMSSETHTERQLYDFIKKHSAEDEFMAMTRAAMIVCWINIAIGFINFFTIKSKDLGNLIIGINIGMITLELVGYYTNAKRYDKKLENLIIDNMVKRRTEDERKNTKRNTRSNKKVSK